jgi:hypothetical protein
MRVLRQLKPNADWCSLSDAERGSGDGDCGIGEDPLTAGLSRLGEFHKVDLRAEAHPQERKMMLWLEQINKPGRQLEGKTSKQSGKTLPGSTLALKPTTWPYPADRDPEPVRRVGTCTTDLYGLADWLKKCGIDSVAMESTGVYWIPAYEILTERGFEVVLVNTRGVGVEQKTGRARLSMGFNSYTVMDYYGRRFGRKIGDLRLALLHATTSNSE